MKKKRYYFRKGHAPTIQAPASVRYMNRGP